MRLLAPSTPSMISPRKKKRSVGAASGNSSAAGAAAGARSRSRSRSAATGGSSNPSSNPSGSGGGGGGGSVDGVVLTSMRSMRNLFISRSSSGGSSKRGGARPVDPPPLGGLFARSAQLEPLDLHQVFDTSVLEEGLIASASDARGRLMRATRGGVPSAMLIPVCQAYVAYGEELETREESVRRRFGKDWKGRFSWQSALAENAHFFESEFYTYERAMALSMYGVLKLRSALETDVDIFTSKNPTKLSEQSKCAQEAAGIFQHLESTILPRAFAEVGRGAPPELHPDTTRSLRHIALAVSQTIAVRLGALRAMSAGTLSKLSSGADRLLQSAMQTARAPGDLVAPVAPSFFSALRNLARLLQVLNYKFRAVEAHGAGRFGAAVTLARAALEGAQQAASRAHCLTAKGAAAEMEEITELFARYEKENSRIYYEMEPSLDELPNVQCKIIAKASPYTPPPVPAIAPPTPKPPSDAPR